MNLYAFQPNGHGELSFFVMAESEEAALETVRADIRHRLLLPRTNSAHITPYDISGFGTDYYTLTVAKAGEVLTNEND